MNGENKMINKERDKILAKRQERFLPYDGMTKTEIKIAYMVGAVYRDRYVHTLLDPTFKNEFRQYPKKYINKIKKHLSEDKDFCESVRIERDLQVMSEYLEKTERDVFWSSQMIRSVAK